MRSDAPHRSDDVGVVATASGRNRGRARRGPCLPGRKHREKESQGRGSEARRGRPPRGTTTAPAARTPANFIASRAEGNGPSRIRRSRRRGSGIGASSGSAPTSHQLPDRRRKTSVDRIVELRGLAGAASDGRRPAPGGRAR